MNRKLKLMPIMLWLVAVNIAALADDLETKSGKTFKNYSITARKGSNVTVSHAGGVTMVPIADLPDRIAWPYVKSKVEDMIFDAKRANTLDQTERKLREIVRQYPASKEMVEKELVQVQKKKEIENQISAILSSGNMDEQLGKLRKLLEKHRENPELEQRIDNQIVVQKSKQKKLAETLAQKIQEAEKVRDPEKALNQLRALLKEHPNHPYSTKQQEYEERINRLISTREAEYKKYQERRQEIRQQLQGIWQLNFTDKRPHWQSIFKSYYAVDRALTKARELQEQESYDQAIAEVEKIIRQEPRISAAAGAQDFLKTLINQREEIRQAQRRLAESREAVKQIRFNDSSQRAQIVINKKINVSTGATVFIFPIDRKKDIMELHKIIDNILSNYLSYKKHYSEGKRLSEAADRVNITGISSFNESSNRLDQGESYMRQAQTSLQLFEKYHNEAKNILLQIAMQSMQNSAGKKQRLVQLKSEPVTLSNIRGPVILFAYEIFNFRAPDLDYNSYQSWYMEYTPTSETVNWDLK